MGQASVVAIDGPAGSGKSTLGRALAARLGYLYFDTGVLYRAVTWLALQTGVDPADEGAVVALVERARPDVSRATRKDGRLYTVTIDGRDVTWDIRELAVDASVSVVSAHARLRQALLGVQRAIAARGRVVLVGRDIGTVVAPEADVKIYLDASPAVRAERRYRELLARGVITSLAEVQAEMRRRDEIDSGRAAAPLAPAPDAIVISSDCLSVDHEVKAVAELVTNRPGRDC